MQVAIYILIPVLVVVCLLMVLVVLMQRPKQEGLGASFGAGVTDQIWGSQTTNVLQKFTVRLAVLFFALSLTLCILEAKVAKSKAGLGVIDALPTEKIVPTPVTPPTTTSVPVEVKPEATKPAEAATPEAGTPADPATPDATKPEAPAGEIPAPAEPATEPAVPKEAAPDAPK